MTDVELSLCGFLAQAIYDESVAAGCTVAEAIEHLEVLKDEIPLLVAQALHEVRLETEQGGLPG